jgi:lipase
MRLNAYEWGDPDGPPLVCVHGASSHGLRYRNLIVRHLADHRALSVDLRGHGRSSDEPPWRLETHVDDLLETAAATGIERAVWMGHSFGGRLVSELAAAHPERVERLVLLDPAAGRLDPTGRLERAESLLRDESFASVEEAVRAWRAELTLAPDDLVEESVRDSIEQGEDGRWRYRYSRVALIAGFGDLALEPPPPARVPTLLVLAADSDLVRPEHVDRLRDGLGGLLEIVTVPGGHQVLLDALPETGAAVGAFLRAGVPA